MGQRVLWVLLLGGKNEELLFCCLYLTDLVRFVNM